MRKISAKKLKALGGKMPFSTIASPRKAVRKSKRSKSERERIYGPKGFVEWIHEQPCVACGVVGYSECAHIKTGGTGMKADWTDTVPLCGPRNPPHRFRGPLEGCHAKLHRAGRVTFGVAFPDFDPEAEASKVQIAWLSIKGEEK